MKLSKRIMPIAALMVIACLASSLSAQVRDEAGFFSAAAIEKVNNDIRDMRQQYRKDLLIETIPSVPADQQDQLQNKGKQQFFLDYSWQRAQSAKIDGIYVLVCKDPTYLEAVVGKNTKQKAFTAADRDELSKRLIASFKAKQYDQGLADAVGYVKQTLATNLGTQASASSAGNAATGTPPPVNAPAYPAPTRPSQHPSATPSGSHVGLLLLVIFGGLLVFSIFKRMASGRASSSNYQAGGAPPMGMNQPGYGYGPGTGGSGFGRGILGGLLGGMAGGWMFDQYRNRGQGGYTDSNAPPPLPPTDSGSFPSGSGGDFGSGPSDMSSGGGDFGGSADSGSGGDFGGGGGGGGGDSGSGGSF